MEYQTVIQFLTVCLSEIIPLGAGHQYFFTIEHDALLLGIAELFEQSVFEKQDRSGYEHSGNLMFKKK